MITELYKRALSSMIYFLLKQPRWAEICKDPADSFVLGTVIDELSLFIEELKLLLISEEDKTLTVADALILNEVFGLLSTELEEGSYLDNENYFEELESFLSEYTDKSNLIINFVKRGVLQQ